MSEIVNVKLKLQWRLHKVREAKNADFLRKISEKEQCKPNTETMVAINSIVGVEPHTPFGVRILP